MNDTEIRNNLVGMISDDYKSLYGIRPRGYDWDGMTIEELKAWSDELVQSIHEQIAYERAEEMAHEQAMNEAFIRKPWTLGEIMRLA